MCRPEEKYDPKSGQCIPNANRVEEIRICLPGFKLDPETNWCVPESPEAQASDEFERCVLKIKSSLIKKNPRMDHAKLKSSAYAICSAQLKK